MELTTTSTSRNLPPMLQQYVSYKQKYPDHFIFFQVGDFYELFFEDAVSVSKILNITLTSRDKSSENRIPMCGVPISVLETYVERILNQGHSAVIVSQQKETSNSKGMLQRNLSKIVTPGVRILSHNNRESSKAILASLYFSSAEIFSIAYTNIQNGKIWIRENINIQFLHQEILKIAPNEIVFYNKIDNELVSLKNKIVNHLFSIYNISIKLRGDSYINNSTFDNIIKKSSLTPDGKKALQLILSYISETRIDISENLFEIAQHSFDNTLYIDSYSQKSLNIVPDSTLTKNTPTLFNILNNTLTITGEKLLKEWLQYPLTSYQKINYRLNAVEYLLKNPEEKRKLRNLLSKITDLERISIRLRLNLLSPKEFIFLRDALESISHIHNILNDISENLVTKESTDLQLLSEIKKTLGFDTTILTELQRLFLETAPYSIEEGGIFNANVDEELDYLRNTLNKGDSWIGEFEDNLKKETGINSLKIRNNNLIGYFIELSLNSSIKAPESFILKQATVNSKRYVLPELKEKEELIINCKFKIAELEKNLFLKFRDQFRLNCEVIKQLSESVSTVDVLQSLADVAEKNNYCKPEINNSENLYIKDGCHPILQNILNKQCIPNNVEFNETTKRVAILTGPNMGGKSTYLKLTGIIVIMAQIGSFVSATEAKIGIVDKIFTRIGASDNLAEGESTFMVEMRETASILINSTKKSLVLVDEVGRGTSSLDGLCIAKNVLIWIAEKISCRTIFATHFHEISELNTKFESVYNIGVDVMENVDNKYDESFNNDLANRNNLIFTHKIINKSSKKSYGLDVAKSAGLPEELIKMATDDFNSIVEKRINYKENKNPETKYTVAPKLVNQINLPGLNLKSDSDNNTKAKNNRIHEYIEKLSPDNLTPLEALRCLYKIKELYFQQS